ncbi:MAG: AAA family ATPase [Thermoleophilia bacterium]|nr:AAA family ATPase [Thermoleophilia bacterium]MDH4339256.1 AAA family ATPase [Thermoleophilia bacterium]MDH5281725.1 AAA family ATPase [Thermoleophilia bacterium]
MSSTTEASSRGSAKVDGVSRAAGRSRRIVQLRVVGFRSIVDATLAPGRLCALVGEAQVGKSNLLAAIYALLDEFAVLEPTSTTFAEGPILIEATLETGEQLALETSDFEVSRTGEPPPVLYLPALERAANLVAAEPDDPLAERALGLFREALDEQGRGMSAPSGALPAASLVDGLEDCCVQGITGLVLLIEEPELFLRPQAQRYVYRLLRTFAQGGNQVFYTTHSPNLLNVARLDELAIVRLTEHGTRAFQPEALTPGEDFRLMTEFDAERSELFLARAALLVEGQTERLALPFGFAACGYDADREGISIVECGGKPNILLFARVCRAAGIPFVVLHDRDRRDQVLNTAIRELAGDSRTVVLRPDFEHVAGLRGGSHKPERAWHHFARMSRDELPEPLRDAVELVVELAREGGSE